jgi:hypothetical protein
VRRLLILLVGFLIAPALTAGAAGSAGAAACSAPPTPVVGVAGSSYSTVTSSQGTVIGTLVPALRPWLARQAEAGGRFTAWLVQCARPGTELPPPALHAGGPLGAPADRALAALAAARRYPVEMWGHQRQSWGSLVAAAVVRGRVDRRPAWIFALVGPRAVDWRYAVVDDRERVLSWQLTGTDVERLLGIQPQAGAR